MFFPNNKGFKPGSPSLGRQTPRTSTFEDQWGLQFESARGQWKTKILFFKGIGKISHAPNSAEAVIWNTSGSDPHANLGEPPREAGGNYKCWLQPFSGVHSTMKTLMLASTILESCFPPISARSLPTTSELAPVPGQLGPHSHIGGTWPHPPAGWHCITLETRGECVTRPHSMSPT